MTQIMEEPQVTATTTPTPSTMEVPEYKAPEVDKEYTVGSEITGLLDKGGSYLESARTEGKQYAASRGLLNSSLGAEAAEQARVKAALPIAQQDAQYKQQQVIQGQAGDIKSQHLGMQAGYSSKLSAQEAAQALEKERFVQNAQNVRQAAENEMKTMLAQMEITMREKESIAQSISDMGQVFSDQVATIQRDPNVTPENKAAAIASLQAAYESNLKSMAGIYGVEIDFGPLAVSSGGGGVGTVGAGGSQPATGGTPSKETNQRTIGTISFAGSTIPIETPARFPYQTGGS